MVKKSRLLVLVTMMFALLFVSGCSTGTSDSSSDSSSSEETTEVSMVETGVNEYFANMPEDIHKISQTDFVDMVKAGEDMTIIDIRSADAYAEGHVKGALSMPWGTELAANIENIPNDKPVMIYCVTGQTAGQTVMLFNLAGFDAKSVNLGYKLGISAVEGVEEVIETTPNEFDTTIQTEIDPEILEAINSYYAGLADVKDTEFANYKISEDDAYAMLGDDTVQFLSVRKADDYAAGHIEGAINIPFGAGMEEEFSTLPMDKTIIVYCYTGQTAGQTVAGLRLLGYDAVSLNAGNGTDATGTAGWTNKGYPLVTE
ncbi:rhodanese-like domain-containing protein [Eubacteriaceae bacterium ES3]|nr:rhodanese-like domain-containing protein [Eubacteriaceae bacterium ES3]